MTFSNYFRAFQQDVANIPLPARFTFPFYYEPHPLALLAVTDLQVALSNAGWDHTFGTSYEKKDQIVGKMFGVLVVRNKEGKPGYIAAYSGKLDTNECAAPFVPPVFDLLNCPVYQEGEQELNVINSRIEELEISPEMVVARELLKSETDRLNKEISSCKDAIREGKQRRKAERAVHSDPALLERLRLESVREQYYLKDLTKEAKSRIAELEEALARQTAEMEGLKNARRVRSNGLQQYLFDNYFFLNKSGEKKYLPELFRETGFQQPPSGAGECAAPKLLQYAFLNGLDPICMAEFWWGQSPSSEIRQHGQFYPACRGKCAPILRHMLTGTELDNNPLEEELAIPKELETVYEDDHLLVINKPGGFLSVPGIMVNDSVYSRMLKKYPGATGPLIVHRLDMSTSGLMLIAKSKEVHEHLQRQFLNRTVKKRYTAILEGKPEKTEGLINLPLRPDPEDRPRQLVCHEFGKSAKTTWNLIEDMGHRAKIHFFPLTGRTHQLRVHAAHAEGLNLPIAGDDIYGTKAERLYLHASSIAFSHPVTGEAMTIEAEAEF